MFTLIVAPVHAQTGGGTSTTTSANDDADDDDDDDGGAGKWGLLGLAGLLGLLPRKRAVVVDDRHRTTGTGTTHNR